MSNIGICELKVPPALQTLVAGLLMWAGAKLAPGLRLGLATPWQVTLAAVLLLAGVAVALAGVLAFRKARTTVNPMTPEASTAIVDHGIYRISRNPMYLGFLLALAGWAVLLANLLALAVLPLFVLYMNRFQIIPEERALLARFGDGYLAYSRSVRRWL